LWEATRESSGERKRSGKRDGERRRRRKLRWKKKKHYYVTNGPNKLSLLSTHYRESLLPFQHDYYSNKQKATAPCT